MRYIFAGFALSTMLLYNEAALAEPWFTGPLLATAGKTTARGHTNFEVYGFRTINHGRFNNARELEQTSRFTSTVVNPVFCHGITDNLDLQFSIPYAYNESQHRRFHKFGDAAVTLGYQLIEQKDSKWRPNLRGTVQEILPSGTFTELDPSLNGTDATGTGSYQTVFGLNFQHLHKFNDVNYLRTRLNLNFAYAAPVDITGLSVYGGTPDTVGRINPGNFYALDLAGEYTLSQHWVAVMETFISRREPTHFSGFIGRNPDGTPGAIGHGVVELYTLAPAIEYNFTSNVGLIAGPWFTVAGRNTSRFISYVLALNAYW
jgi:hypothetical protein